MAEKEYGHSKTPSELVKTQNSAGNSENTGKYRYELKEEIARGAMGAVVRSTDRLLNRELAVKVLIEGSASDPDSVQRFFDEAQINGQLQHPGIVPVYELGVLPDERPFFAMKLVKGETLKCLLDERESPQANLTKFLGIFEQVCQTIAYAHSRKVIHRDLKPANIMVGTFGEVQVMDWGIAKLLDTTDPKQEPASKKTLETKIRTIRSSLDGSSGAGFQTNDGVVFGTLAYMSPEQALGETNQVDESSDVFGLGAILCTILTGAPPYEGENTQRLFRQAAQCRLDDAWDRLENCKADPELVGLTKECLAAEPGDRPANAGVIAARVSNYFVSVDRRLREAELSKTKIQEQKKRHRVLTALAALILFSVTSLAILWGLVQEQHAAADRAMLKVANSELSKQQQLAELREKARNVAIEAEEQQSVLRQKAEHAKINTERMLCDVNTRQGVRAAQQRDAGAAMMWFASAARLAPENSHRRKTNLLRANNWARNTAVPVGALEVPGRPYSVEIQPEGGDLVIVRFTPLDYGFRDAQGPTEIFQDVEGEELKWLSELEFQPVSRVKHPNKFVVYDWRRRAVVDWVDNSFQEGIPCWSPDGKWLVIASPVQVDGESADWKVQIREVANGNLLKEITGLDEVTAVNFSNDAGRLAIATQRLRVWSMKTLEQIETMDWPSTAEIHAVTFSPDDQFLVAAALDSVASVYQVGDDSAKLAFQIPHMDLVLKQWVNCRHAPVWVERNDGGLSLVGITGCESIAVWDAGTGKFIEKIDTKFGTIGKTRAAKDGYFAVAANRGLEIRSESNLKQVACSMPADEIVTSIGINDTGSLALVGNFDTKAQLCSLPDMIPRGPQLFHDNVVGAVDISSDDRWMATATVNGLVRIWAVPDLQQRKEIYRYAHPREIEISADGKYMLSSKCEAYMELHLAQESVEVVDLSGAQLAPKTLEVTGAVKDSCWLDSLSRVIVVSEKDERGWLTMVKGVGASSANSRVELSGLPYWVEPHPTKPLVAVVCENGNLELVDLAKREVANTWPQDFKTSWLAFLEFTSDGDKLIACTADYFEVYDVQSKELCFERIYFPNSNSENCFMTVSPDSQKIAVSARDSVCFWDLNNGQSIAEPLIHTQTSHYLGAVSFMRFSPDSQLLLTCSLDRHARLWDWRAGHQVCPAMEHGSKVRSAAFLGDGAYAVTGSDGSDCGPHFWDLKTGMKLAPSFESHLDPFCSVVSLCAPVKGTKIYGCANVGDGYATFQCDFGKLLQPGKLSIQEFVTLGQLTSSKQITLGQADRLPAKHWLERWRSLNVQDFRTALPNAHRIFR